MTGSIVRGVGASPGLDVADLARIRHATEFVRAHDTVSVLTEALPGLTPGERSALRGHSRFGHAALLVFPGTLDGLREDLRGFGLVAGEATPSVVVRDRVSRRSGLPAAEVRIDVLRAPVADRSGQPCALEIFAMTSPPGAGHAGIAEDERAHGHESHVALELTAPDDVVLNGLRALLAARARLSADGGGYNGHEDSTVLYFRDATIADPLCRRLGLVGAGHFPGAVTEHRRGTGDAGTRLLRLMTGAWATQAIAVAAELRLADHLDRGATTVALAAATGTDHDSLVRLLRYLAGLGVVRASGSEYALTELGALLRTGVADSLHPLARIYGGPFYASFARLGDSVRTGTESYERVFGAHHFAHMAADPELADLFDRAMAASSAMFGEFVRVVDLGAARVVVDVAGGNGALLSRLLTTWPRLRGVLLEQPHALRAAKSIMDSSGCADRCALVSGDFTERVPPGGDAYLLSRVLHDWDDDRCAEILTRCAEAMPAHAELYVVERLLPEDGADSLAVPWDVHMLCNVGGRERTQSHYARLLADAGFELVDRHDLPLDAAVLRARRLPG
ncbi:methyltransferase [Amycolatopsis samaneae]|uniref:Methyltransferase n=1 Tax=Amycolatopsis samaneae TaxID=664691 RepID=A0ABW5G6N9_9PSEU